MLIQYPVTYSAFNVNQEVYLHGPRGSDLNPYRVTEVLAGGQYKISRIVGGQVQGRTASQGQLKTTP